jgi:hypothetical protein
MYLKETVREIALCQAASNVCNLVHFICEPRRPHIGQSIVQQGLTEGSFIKQQYRVNHTADLTH